MPPRIIESQTTQVAEITEHSNVSIQCKAHGHPRPSVVWRREDGLPIRLNGRFGGADNLSRDALADVNQMPVIAQPGADTTSDPAPVTMTNTRKLMRLHPFDPIGGRLIDKHLSP